MAALAARGLSTRDLEALKRDLKCKICMMLFDDPAILPCGHVFCRGCAVANLVHAKVCALCRTKYTHRSLYPCGPVADMCRALESLGDTIGVADIVATQLSQPFVIKPFVAPMRKPVGLPAPPPQALEPAGPIGGDALSQCLRQAKSQKAVVDMDDDDDDDAEADPDDQDTVAAPTVRAGRGRGKDGRGGAGGAEDEPRHLAGAAPRGACGRRGGGARAPATGGKRSAGPAAKRVRTDSTNGGGDAAASKDPACDAGHALHRCSKRRWLCANARFAQTKDQPTAAGPRRPHALARCASGMSHTVAHSRVTMMCEACDFCLCLQCHKEERARAAAAAKDSTCSTTDAGGSDEDDDSEAEETEDDTSTSDSDDDSGGGSVADSSSGDDAASDASAADSAPPPGAKCVLCGLPVASEEAAEAAAAQLLEKARVKGGCEGGEGGLLGGGSAAAVAGKLLEGVVGPYDVAWHGGWRRKGEPVAGSLRRRVWAHELCLLWCPKSRSGDGGAILARSAAPAVRSALNRRCASCGGWGAGVCCTHPRCKAAYHVPCGLFTPHVGYICPKTFTVHCKQHASRKRKRKRS